jgi:hypothetical protein
MLYVVDFKSGQSFGKPQVEEKRRIVEETLEAGASCFPERRLALGTILLCAAGHGLPDNVKLASNLRLVPSALP